MSFDALAWAAKQRPGNLAAKMVLLALANYANEHAEAYPSTAAIADFGDMNHKTATSALDRLEALGMISDTGKKAGRSGQIKVYRLALESHPKTEASQKREPPKFSTKAPQKRVTDTVKEPTPSEAKASSGGAASPHRLPEDWQPPAIEELSATVRALVGQWPRGAYQAVCETFRLHWLAETRPLGRKSNWTAALGKWLISDHAKVMRDAKAGVSFARLGAGQLSEPPGGRIEFLTQCIKTYEGLGRDAETGPWRAELAKLREHSEAA